MLKKSLCTILATIMLLSLGACNNRQHEGSDTDVMDNVVQSEDINDIVSENIRQNGELPSTFSELTKEEVVYYNEKIIKALQTFDYETIEELTDPEVGNTQLVIEALKRIEDDPKYKTMYEKTVGQVRFLKGSNCMLSRSVHYVFNNWFNDMEAENEPLPEETGKVAHDVADALYEKYFVNAPYTVAVFNDYGEDCKIENGRIIYNNIDNIFWQVGFAYILQMAPNYYLPDIGYANMVLGGQSNLELGYDYILKEDNCPDYKELMTLDLDKMIEIVDQCEEQDDSYNKRYYQKIYKDEKYRKIIQDWIDENCIAVRGFQDLLVYIKADVETSYPYCNFTQEDKDALKSLELFGYGRIGNVKQSFKHFQAYSNILEEMDNRGIIDIEAIMAED